MKTLTKSKKKSSRAKVKAVWPMQDAQNSFNELVERVLRGEEQTITRDGKPVARLVPVKDSEPRENLVDFMRRSPLYGVELDLTRDKSLPRDIEL